MDKTRQKIIDATMHLVMEKGYASMTTKEIAEYAQLNEIKFSLRIRYLPP